MKFEDIVTSHELSKKLAEAGVAQEEGYAFWAINDFGKWSIIDENYTWIKQTSAGDPFYRTFTFNELWEMLPKKVNFCGSKTLWYHLELHKGSIGYFRHSIQEGELLEDSMKSKLGKLQEAAGELLLWCIEQGYVSPKET